MSHPTRILVVTDTSEGAPELVTAIAARANDDVRFRLVVLNPARAEVHLLHPERRDKAREAEKTLAHTLERLEEVIGAHRIVGSVSVRHDPMDAVEETLFAEPVDEIVLHVREHALARRLHQDLPHRLAHYGIPIQTVDHALVH